MVLRRRASALLNVLTCGSFSPLQGEGRGFETLSATKKTPGRNLDFATVK